MAQDITITVHGKTYTGAEISDRRLELRNLNFNLGESDGRVTELNAIDEACYIAMIPVREALLREKFASATSKYVFDKGIELHCQNKRGMCKLKYKSEQSAFDAIPRIARNKNIFLWDAVYGGYVSSMTPAKG